MQVNCTLILSNFKLEDAVDNSENVLEKVSNSSVDGVKSVLEADYDVALITVEIEDAFGIYDEKEGNGNKHTCDEQAEDRTGNVPEEEDDEGNCEEEAEDTNESTVNPGCHGGGGDVDNESAENGSEEESDTAEEGTLEGCLLELVDCLTNLYAGHLRSLYLGFAHLALLGSLGGLGGLGSFALFHNKHLIY